MLLSIVSGGRCPCHNLDEFQYVFPILEMSDTMQCQMSTADVEVVVVVAAAPRSPQLYMYKGQGRYSWMTMCG